MNLFQFFKLWAKTFSTPEKDNYNQLWAHLLAGAGIHAVTLIDVKTPKSS